MPIAKADVAAMASLARLDLPDATMERFAGQLDQVLDYMAKLAELDTAGVEPLYSPVEQPAPLRPDEAVREFDRQDILANAPRSDGRFFIVPKIV